MSPHFERSNMSETTRESAFELLVSKLEKRLGEDRELEPLEDTRQWTGLDGLPFEQSRIVEEEADSVSRFTGVKLEYPDWSAAFVQAMINLGKYSENGRGRSNFSPKD